MIEKIELARKYIKEKLFEKAEEILLFLLNNEYDKELIHYELGKLYFFREQYGKAIEHLKEASTPSLFQAYLYLGLSYEQTMQYYSAEKSYMEAIKIKPKFSSSYNQLATLYREQKNLSKGQEILEKALEMGCKNDPLIYLNLGSIYGLRGFYNEAIETLETGRKLAPEDREILTSLGEVYLNRRDYDKALEIFKIREKLYEDESLSYVNTGSVYHGMKDFKEAEKYYLKATEQEDVEEESYYLLATIYGDVYKDYEKAIDFAKKAIEVSPEFIPVHLLEIHSHYHLGKLSEIKSKYEELVKSNPGSAKFKLCLGNCYLHEENYEAAKELFNQAIEIHRNGIPFPCIYAVYIALAHTYDYMEMNSKAIEYIKIPLMEDPYSDELHFAMGLFQRKSGLKEEGRASMERAISLNPESVISYCSRAYIYLDEGNCEKAMEEAKKAEEIIYKSDRVYYIIGLIEEEMKHIKEAIKYYKKTIDYNHLHRDAKKRLMNLESRGNYGTCS